MADFRLNVTADTQEAKRALKDVDQAANKATRERAIKIDSNSFKEVSRNFNDLKGNIKEAGNNIQQFYRFSKNIPGIGDRVKDFENLAKGTAELAKNAPATAAGLKESAKAGNILARSMDTAGGAANQLIGRLAKVGFALFAVKEGVGVLRAAFNGFFNETIGREIKLRETILKTQTTLASTNKVFKNGQEITDPYEKIVSLTGAVKENIDSIRVRSLELAGVTSGEVIEVFGIVAAQVGQIGGGLKEAEDLAIQFSAALGTFRIPLYQARQEIGSILRGDITMDSYLAKALGITNEDIARAKTEAGGVVKFLEDRLAAAVAGQRIAAEGFAGVVSNIQEIAELTSQAFGEGLLDPLLGGLTNVYKSLFGISEVLIEIARNAGKGIGSILGDSGTIIGGSSGFIQSLVGSSGDIANQLKATLSSALTSLGASLSQVLAPLQNLIEEIIKSVGVLGQGLAKLAAGFASLQIENFKALVQVFSNLAEGATILAASVSGVLGAYGELLKQPIVQYLSQIKVQFELLDRVGLGAVIKLVAASVALRANWAKVVTFFQAAVARIAAVVASGLAALSALLTQTGASITALGATLTRVIPQAEALSASLIKLGAVMNGAGASAGKASVALGGVGTAAGGAAKGIAAAAFSFIKFNLILLAVQVVVTAAIDLFGRWQKAQEKAARNEQVVAALGRLEKGYGAAGEKLDYATQKQKELDEALRDSAYRENAEELKKLNKELERRKKLLADRTQFGDTTSGITKTLQSQIKYYTGEIAKLESENRKIAAQEDKANAQEVIRIEQDKRINLNKEIKEIRIQQERDIFGLRQNLAMKEVEIFRLAGEIRIQQMERANAKLIEGEEGASRAALEALNNYLSTRERGELDIEASKQQLVIEVANLEQQVADYRLSTEKKIAEIRRRSQLNEAEIIKAYEKVHGGPGRTGSTGLKQGATGGGDITGAHFHVSGAATEAEARAIFANAGSLQTTDVPGSPRSGGRKHAGYDLAGPAGTELQLAAGYVLKEFIRNNGLMGNTAVIGGPGGKEYKVGHLQDPGKDYKLPSATDIQLADLKDIGAPAVEKYAAAVRNLESAMQRLRVLQAQLTEAKTKDAFDQIAKAAFPKIAVEQYKDQLEEANFYLKGVSASSAEAFDPERLRLAAENQARQVVSQRELQEILAKAKELRKSGQLSEAELVKLTGDLTERQRKFVEQLLDELKIRNQILAATRAAEAIAEAKKESKGNRTKAGDIAERTRLERTGMSSIEIDGAMQKRELDRRFEERSQGLDPKAVENLRKEYDALKESVDAVTKAQLDAADPIGNLISTWAESIEDVRGQFAQLAQTIQSELASAMTNSITGLINGTTTVQEAFSQMFANIGRAFIDMAMQILTKAVVLQILKMFMPGGGASGGGGLAGFEIEGTLAGGGVFEGAGPTFADGGVPPIGKLSIVGERGPELFMPSRTGTIVPNDVFAATRAAMNSGAMNRQAFAANEEALALSSGITRERLMERERETMLASSGGSLRIETQVINNVEYATVDQVTQATAASAKKAKAQVFADMRNKPSTRASLGMR